MPTYDYICEKCGDRFEHFQKMSSEPLSVCAKCGGHLKRLIGSGVGIIFKGSGFYCTDYRSKGGGAASQSESKPASESKPSTETKSETAAAPAKSETTSAAAATSK